MKLEQQTTATYRQALPRSLGIAILFAGLLVILGAISPGPYYWPTLALGLTIGILSARHRFRRWSDYALSFARAWAKRWGATGFMLYFVFLIIFSFLLPILVQSLDRSFAGGVAGFLVGCAEGFYLWPLWLYLRRDKEPPMG